MQHVGRCKRLQLSFWTDVRVVGGLVLLLGVPLLGVFLLEGRPGAVGGASGWGGTMLQSSAVTILVVLLVGGLVAALAYWRTSYLERSREQLEREVAERTQEVQRQKEQLLVYNRELKRTADQLRDAVEEKSKLLGVAAHDLKNPLVGIRALSEIVLENEDLSARVQRKLNLIRESADEAMARIDEIMASAASTAQAPLDVEPVDLGGLTQWVVHSFAPHAQRKQQKLRCSVPDAVCVVKGHKRRLREAVSNLVSNALKYSPPEQVVAVRVYRQGEQIAVEVADKGPGLSEADQKRMFAPFQRLTPTPTGDESSSGLGLYIVKQIVELHDGTIEVESTRGEGSTFRMLFPAAEPDADPVPATNPPAVEEIV